MEGEEVGDGEEGARWASTAASRARAWWGHGDPSEGRSGLASRATGATSSRAASSSTRGRRRSAACAPHPIRWRQASPQPSARLQRAGRVHAALSGGLRPDRRQASPHFRPTGGAGGRGLPGDTRDRAASRHASGHLSSPFADEVERGERLSAPSARTSGPSDRFGAGLRDFGAPGGKPT